ncbi:MAG TPA: DUF374 domain-containing protein [Candidatus Eisenbacteria bacterium]
MLGAWFIRLLGATWRVEWRGGAASGPEGEDPHRCIFAFWHARMLSLAFTHRDRGGAVLVSRSRDGEIITRVIERLGFVAARGSSTRGGEEGRSTCSSGRGRSAWSRSPRTVRGVPRSA